MMKIFGLIAFISLMSPILEAREYVQKNVVCRFYGTEQDVFNKERELPFDLVGEYIFGIDAKTNEVLAVRGMSRPRINATSAFNQGELDTIINKLGFDNKVGNISLSSEELKKLITYFGDYRAQVNEHELPAVNGRLEVGKQRLRLQSHLPPETDYGLTYHIVISCKEKGTRVKPPRTDRPSTPTPTPRRNDDCTGTINQCPTYILVTGWYPCPTWYNPSKQCYGPHYRQVFNNPTSRDRY